MNGLFVCMCKAWIDVSRALVLICFFVILCMSICFEMEPYFLFEIFIFYCKVRLIIKDRPVSTLWQHMTPFQASTFPCAANPRACARTDRAERRCVGR